jgi:OHCU decarboxylase
MTADDALPTLEQLNAMSADAFVAALAPLFEGGTQVLPRLAEARPFPSDDHMLSAAHEAVAGLPEAEQIALVEAHPRIGADSATVSAMSFDEQGYAAEAEGDEETARIYEELQMLNEIYEKRFGFRYVVFVAGRPKAEVVPLLEHALRNDREAELRRAVHDAVYIAGDRLARLRAEREPMEPDLDGPVDER